jgi:hypothetical protein
MSDPFMVSALISALLAIAAVVLARRDDDRDPGRA